ncbi:sensor histidine kinase [Dokdonella sp.]|uniref:sensor histidine kinase n=1 Tax=Dokdonella sp. TaxID=2291710 RepID=UPI002F412895
MSDRPRRVPPLFEAPAPDMREVLARMREQQEQLFAQLQSSEQHFRHLARSVWRVQEDERRRLARDLHDGIGQHLTALRHRLDALAAERTDSAALREAIALCEIAVEETRAMSRLLRPQVLDDLGLDAALRWLARQAGSDACAIEVDVGTLPEIDESLATLVFRVAQEALTNAHKHARARNVVLRLAARGDRLQLLVVDDGIGCDVDAALDKSRSGESTGLASIGERVRLFGGDLVLSSRAGEGFQLRASLPIAGGMAA